MGQIVLFLALLAGLVGGAYAISEGLIQRGRLDERASVERQVATAKDEAAEHYRLAVQVIETERREHERQLVVVETELKGLRDARANDSDSTDVVFDERWTPWLRGDGAAPAAGD